MSFFATLAQIKAQTKTVTRRKGWQFLNPGDILWAIEKGQGLKKGEKVNRICQIRVVSVRREMIALIDKEDVVREGFPDWTAEQFIEMYCRLNGCTSADFCTRVEFEYLQPHELLPAAKHCPAQPEQASIY